MHNSLSTGMPVLVVGSGLGQVKKCLICLACAPVGSNRTDFFEECQSPACYFLPSDYGHIDMFNDETEGGRNPVVYSFFVQEWSEP
ncbi:hypothetical protein AMTRI_Chr03g148420 [Amborella trichopoda]